MRFTRRDALRGGTVLAAGAALPIFERGLRLAHAGPEEDRRVLVVVEMTGGNDGLSTVVPFEDDDYYRARSATAIPQDSVLRFGEGLGLHPNLDRLRPVFDAGRMAVVLGAGYPNPNRSHFESMDVWHSGRVDGRRAGTGWLGRAVDSCCAERSDPEVSVAVGEAVPFALEAKQHKPIAFEEPAAYRWTGASAPAESFEALNRRREGGGLLAWLHRTAEDARRSSERVRAAAAAYRPKTPAARGPLGRDLAVVSALVASDLPTRVFYTSLGGFDTHTGQRGRHDGLMRQLGDAVAGFLAEVEASGNADRVLVLAFSEFGRRVRENGSQGTDHGAAAPMFLFGRPVKGGAHGRAPSLTDLDDGDLKMTTDFRSVYAAVLERWIGAPAKDVLGEEFAPLPVLA